MFVDECKIKLKAGDGGDGCVSFHREKYIPNGGPNGGDGGNGGDVVFVCDRNMSDLTEYRWRPEWKAQNGDPGKGRECHGKSGTHLEIKVPEGTVVLDWDTGEFVTELIKHDQRVRILRGGKGGLGNLHFKSSINQAPIQMIPGKPGFARSFRLVLKTVADVGLVGFPNAGKSSMLCLLTKAHPKTAPYPFTTLFPTVGVMEFPEQYERLTLADIPGLIEGASENKGLGHRFLKHIERCRLLVVLVDMAGTDGRDPAEDYAHLINEMGLYQKDLLDRPSLVVANKMDEPDAVENLKAFRKRHKVDLFPVSILSEEGIPEMRQAILKKILELRATMPEPELGPVDLSVEDRSPNVVVEIDPSEQGVRRVRGEPQVPSPSEESLPELGGLVEITDGDEGDSASGKKPAKRPRRK